MIAKEANKNYLDTKLEVLHLNKLARQIHLMNNKLANLEIKGSHI